LQFAFGNIFRALKRHHHATALGVSAGQTNEPLTLNPPDNRVVQSGDILYYMADRRLSAADLDWRAIAQEAD
jgi:voltage-gated potassium channel